MEKKPLTKHPETRGGINEKIKMFNYWLSDWLRGLDLNQRPSGYEPDARTLLPDPLILFIK